VHGVVNTKGALTYTVLDTVEYSIFFSFRLENCKFTMHHVANTKGALAHTVPGTFKAYGQGEISEPMKKKARDGWRGSVFSYLVSFRVFWCRLYLGHRYQVQYCSGRLPRRHCLHILRLLLCEDGYIDNVIGRSTRIPVPPLPFRTRRTS